MSYFGYIAIVVIAYAVLALIGMFVRAPEEPL